MDLHPGEQVVFEGHPSWRALLSFYIGGVAGALVIAVIVALIATTFAGVVTAVVLVAAVLGFGLLKRIATTYLVSTQRLYIRRGMLSKRVQQTRIDRVQNVNTAQSMRERMLRVGTVDFDTAGSDDSEFRFVGIANPGDVVNAVDRAQREASIRPGAEAPRDRCDASATVPAARASAPAAPPPAGPRRRACGRSPSGVS